MTHYSNKIQAKVLCLSWHPVHENILAFSTEEGRVGILDTNKQSNVPIIMKPFSGKPVYQISWGSVSNGNDSRYVLFACSAGKLVYFPESGEGKHCKLIFNNSYSALVFLSNYLIFESEILSLIQCFVFYCSANPFQRRSFDLCSFSRKTFSCTWINKRLCSTVHSGFESLFISHYLNNKY